MRAKTKTDLQRFEEKIDKTGSCWVWLAGTTGAGRYGSFYFPNYPSSNATDMVAAHRASLFLYKNVLVPDGEEVLHSCDVGLCCNPDHLSTGSHKENMEDCSRKGRIKNSKQVLNDSMVELARKMREAGELVKDIADHFGMSSSQMSRVTCGCQPKWKRKVGNINE